MPLKFRTLWADKSKAVEKINLLVDFGVYIARTLRPYKIQGVLSRTGRVKRDFAETVPFTAPLPPERLGVHPAFYHDRWEAVRGVFRGVKDLPGYRVLAFLSIE